MWTSRALAALPDQSVARLLPPKVAPPPCWPTYADAETCEAQSPIAQTIVALEFMEEPPKHGERYMYSN